MTPKRQKLVSDYYSNKIPGVELLMDNVWDPHNIAAVFRTADGLGIKTVNMYYTYNRPGVSRFEESKKLGRKSSASARKWIHYQDVLDIKAFADEKKREGFVLVGSHLTPDATKLTDFKFPEKCVIAFGSESLGMSPEVQAVCDRMVYIPMVGMVESYNISVAAGIMMYELFLQRGQHLMDSSAYTDREPNRNADPKLLNAPHAT
ncbi:MAG: RNA methyltransferase [SAR324 cluster bacterium]|nr:RNA methyltransferase [SAR324 cluster bacterium]